MGEGGGGGEGRWGGSYFCDLLTKDVEGDCPHASPDFISGHAGVLSRHAGLPDQQGANGLHRGTVTCYYHSFKAQFIHQLILWDSTVCWTFKQH